MEVDAERRIIINGPATADSHWAGNTDVLVPRGWSINDAVAALRAALSQTAPPEQGESRGGMCACGATRWDCDTAHREMGSGCCAPCLGPETHDLPGAIADLTAAAQHLRAFASTNVTKVMRKNLSREAEVLDLVALPLLFDRSRAVAGGAVPTDRRQPEVGDRVYRFGDEDQAETVRLVGASTNVGGWYEWNVWRSQPFRVGDSVLVDVDALPEHLRHMGPGPYTIKRCEGGSFVVAGIGFWLSGLNLHHAPGGLSDGAGEGGR